MVMSHDSIGWLMSCEKPWSSTAEEFSEVTAEKGTAEKGSNKNSVE
jgi:hypothetical protein